MSMPSVSRPPRTPANNAAGRTVLWIAILLTLALLTFVTIFTANHNPYVNDVARNKISKYQFIEECKTQFDQFATSVGKSQNAVFTTEYDPKSLVAGAVSNPDPKTAGWVLSSTVAVSREGLGSQSIPFACQSDASGKVTLVQQSAPQQ